MTNGGSRQDTGHPVSISFLGMFTADYSGMQLVFKTCWCCPGSRERLKDPLRPAAPARAEGRSHPPRSLKGAAARPLACSPMSSSRTRHCTSHLCLHTLCNALLAGPGQHGPGINAATCSALRGFCKIPWAFPGRAGGKFRFT